MDESCIFGFRKHPTLMPSTLFPAVKTLLSYRMLKHAVQYLSSSRVKEVKLLSLSRITSAGGEKKPDDDDEAASTAASSSSHLSACLPLEVRYLRQYALENNDWHEFQVRGQARHPLVLLLLCTAYNKYCDYWHVKKSEIGTVFHFQ